MLLGREQSPVNPSVIEKMTDTLTHRGPDGTAHLHEPPVSLGFTRLSIIDLAGGMQPLTNEDDSLVLICNGEIFNYIELRGELEKRGHAFKTRTDVEVILHLYEEHGKDFLNKLNGQFAFVLYDKRKGQLFCARDHFGIIPFFYTVANGYFVFGSEIKAILAHPAVEKSLDLVGLDQVYTFPGLVSPRTMFKNVRSLENGHCLTIDRSGAINDAKYWDLDYPAAGEEQYDQPETYYVEKLDDLLDASIRLRLRADVPVGFYLSGGLDSSLIAAKLKQLTPGISRYSFSIDFPEKSTSESFYQRLVAGSVDSVHSEKLFLDADVIDLLPRTIYHCECPLKESYNTASFALSRLVRSRNLKVVLSGEGADELFAGYVGYKFDRLRQMMNTRVEANKQEEDDLRRKLWGDENFFYEKNYWAFGREKKTLYSGRLNEAFDEFDCLNHYVVDPAMLNGRDVLHKRSYVDYKLRMADHLISDHGDRMAMANSVEARYPFLDKNIAEFACTIPPNLKLKDLQEKYILRKIARDIVPREVLNREKFGFVAPPSTNLLKRNHAYINDILSYDTISRQGIFDPDEVERLKKRYAAEGFRLNLPFENDMLITAITLGVFLDQFGFH